MKFRWILLALLAVVAVTLVAQNREVVQFRVLFWTLEMSRIVLLGLAMFVAFSIGFTAATLLAVSGRRAEREQRRRERSAGID